MEKRIETIKQGETQKKKPQTNFVITNEFVGNKKLTELISNLVVSEANKIVKAK